MKYAFTGLILLTLLPRLHAQESDGFKFTRNEGQWAEPFAYMCEIPGGQLFVEKGRIIYAFEDQVQKGMLLDKMHHREQVSSTLVNSHALFMNFLGAAKDPVISASDPYPFYYNYILGNDPSRWKGKVRSYATIKYTDLYAGIDLHMYTDSGFLKYDLVVHPGANAGLIRFGYEGADKMAVKDGNLVIGTSLNEITEKKPYAYQLVNGERKQVECAFVLKKNTVRFALGTYDKTLPLVIDPALIFSTYSGSTKDNWGVTATYDFNDNAYGGGIVFGGNAYPSIPGSFQQNYGGGQYDVMIGKFSPNGNTLLYYTYLGGLQGETPLSLVCNNNNELYVLGTTGSSGFPVTPGAFRTSFSGGPAATVLTGNDYPAGIDIFVSKLSEDGTTLIASTFMGGSANDGLNADASLAHNYADGFRGEIIVNDNDECFVVSSTLSANFPVMNAAQPFLNGVQDAIAFKMSSNLGTLLWGTFLGGSAAEAGYSIQLNAAGEPYVTGGTTSSNFPTTPGVIKPSSAGGVDGFLTRLSVTGNSVLNSTYLGTASYDQCYNVQLDGAGDVYVVGQTTGFYPVSPGVYSNPNSGQFIHKLNPSLTATVFSTVFGRGIPGQIDIVPTAFLVDVCDHIYVAGWGGVVNAGFGGGSTMGLPVTPNAHQSSTDGSDFYLIVLDDNATSLLFATYFGGPVSDEHVDAGTSRFDKNGIVYEAVCAGCGGFDDFPTSPGAWSANNNSTNCNMGVFKFDVSDFTAIIEPLTPTSICTNGSVTVENVSTGGFPHVWDFGDGSPTSTAQIVSHTYTIPGTYVIRLTVNAPNACITSDVDSIVITVEAPPVADIVQVAPLCPGETVQLQASGGDTYQWNPSSTLSQLIIPDPIASPNITTSYIVTVSNNCGTDKDTITVTVTDINADAGQDDTICDGNVAQLSASGGVSYLWNANASLSSTTIPNPVATPSVTTMYIVEVTGATGCVSKDTVTIVVELFPVAFAGNDVNLCLGDQVTLGASGGSTYSWSPTLFLSNPSIANPVCDATSTISYQVTVSNSCGTDTDSMTVRVIRVAATASPDTIICPYTSVMLWAGGGSTYLWSPANLLNTAANDTVIASPEGPTQFIVRVTDSFGCSDFDTVFVDMYPVQDVELGPDVLVEFGDEVTLSVNAAGTVTWSPATYLSCTVCPVTVATPVYSTEYTVTLTDTNGCEFGDSITVFVEGSLYIPNTFTPNGDGINDIFRAQGVDIKQFTMRIFNRWGEELFVTTKLTYGWDGFYMDAPCQLGVYVWKIDYTEVSGESGLLHGHVNLLR